MFVNISEKSYVSDLFPSWKFAFLVIIAYLCDKIRLMAMYIRKPLVTAAYS